MNLSCIARLAFAVSLTLLGTEKISAQTAQTVGPVLDRALIQFKEDKELPAREAGVLVRLTVKQGDKVQAGEEIGLIDDSEPRIQKEIAGHALAAAIKSAKDDVQIRYAEAQAKVEEKNYEMLKEANRIAPKTVTDFELRKGKLAWDAAVLSIEKSTHDQELAKHDAWTKNAEQKAADLAIQRRTIIAPFAGEVVELDRKQDEWVNPGDRILRLAQRDIMTVEGTVKQSEYDPHELHGCAVTVEVQLARGRTETVSGQIVYVSPVLFGSGDYVVRAEVPNREENGNWMLLDGQRAKMTVHLNTADGAPPEISRLP